ncbi:MAG: TIGR01210 family radical SAM protein [Thermoplasmata archaeon]|nr:MAG: TIGR01210 family radical SAM protein [Thermoplasmata archaeon]
MKALAELNRSFREIELKEVKKPRIWKEKELLNGKVANVMVIVLRTPGCYWAKVSGCSMCGYFKETYDAGYDEIKKQIDEAYKKYEGEEIVKFFTSGSFLDEKEMPRDLQIYAIEKFSKAKKIVIESRPEFIKNLEWLQGNIEVAMGLESANDRVLEYSINKGFRFRAWLKNAKLVKKHGKKLRVYILIKPPFLKEIEAIKDAINSARKVADIADVISFNPVAIHGKTIVETLWNRHLYRPPWLWSVVQVIKETKKFYDGMIKCDVVARGMARGAHNCGKCDKKILHAIEEFNLKQDEKIFDGIDCDCREEWLDFLELEEYMI